MAVNEGTGPGEMRETATGESPADDRAERDRCRAGGSCGVCGSAGRAASPIRTPTAARTAPGR